MGRRPAYTLVDKALIFLGFASAIMSASFAVWMTAGEERVPSFAGAEHLRLFARPATVRRIPVASVPPGDGEATTIDKTPIGAIGPRRGVPPALETSNSPLDGWTLHGIFGGTALIAGPDGLVTAAAGADLGAAGRVVGIEFANGGWRLRTTRGVIAPLP